MYKCSTPELPQATVLEASDFTCMVMQVSSLGGLTPKIQKGSAWFSGAKTGSAATPVSSPESQQACNPLVKPIQVLMSTSHPTTTHRWVAFPACFTLVSMCIFHQSLFASYLYDAMAACSSCLQLAMYKPLSTDIACLRPFCKSLHCLLTASAYITCNAVICR